MRSPSSDRCMPLVEDCGRPQSWQGHRLIEPARLTDEKLRSKTNRNLRSSYRPPGAGPAERPTSAPLKRPASPATRRSPGTSSCTGTIRASRQSRHEVRGREQVCLGVVRRQSRSTMRGEADEAQTEPFKGDQGRHLGVAADRAFLPSGSTHLP